MKITKLLILIFLFLILTSCSKISYPDYPELVFEGGPLMMDIDIGNMQGVSFRGLVKNIGTKESDSNCYVVFKMYDQYNNFVSKERVSFEEEKLEPNETSALKSNQFYFENVEIISFSYYFIYNVEGD